MTDEHAVHSLFDALGGEACRAHAVSACPTRPARRLLSTQGPSGLAALLAGSPTAHSELFRVDRRAAVHMLRNMLQSLPWPSTRSTRTHAACAACALPALLVLLVAPARCSRGSPPPRPPQGANTLKLLLELLTVTCWSFSPTCTRTAAISPVSRCWAGDCPPWSGQGSSHCTPSVFTSLRSPALLVLFSASVWPSDAARSASAHCHRPHIQGLASATCGPVGLSILRSSPPAASRPHKHT